MAEPKLMKKHLDELKEYILKIVNSVEKENEQCLKKTESQECDFNFDDEEYAEKITYNNGFIHACNMILEELKKV